MRLQLCLCATVLGLQLPIARVGSAQTDDFPKVFNTQDPRDVPTKAEDTIGKMTLPEGFRATLFASEPDVQQPIAMTTDHRGRLWVAECYTYAERPTQFELKLRDRVVILEDTDGNGRFDRRTVFWDQGRRLTSVEVGFGGVWVLCAPQLLFIPDRDGDDVPDGPPEVLLDGFNDGPVGHNIVNGLKWGPDGWLYGRHGIQATSLVGKPGAGESQRVRLNCSIWRYHPTRHVFEVVTHGTTNPWGFDYDDHGQMFFINTVIGHLWHVVPGAHYRRMYGADFNPHLYQLIDQCADHYHWDTREEWSVIRKTASDSTQQAGGGHAHCGLMIYRGDNWPSQYRGRVFTVNFHGRRLNQDRLERHEAGYVAKHAADFMLSDDPWFRGIDLISGPDGGVFVADWCDVGECHETDGVHRTSGRIYKLVYGEPQRTGSLDLAALDDLDLVKLQLHPNDWYVRQARRILQERAAAGRDLTRANQALLGLFRDQTDVTRKLRAMWCLHLTGGLDEPWLISQLGHPAEHVRVWAVRLLTDTGEPGPAAIRALHDLARRETSGLVQLFLGSAMQRLSLEDRWPIAHSLAARPDFAADPALPLMVWYGIEPAVPADRQRALALVEQSQLPLVRRHIARRLTEEIEGQSVAVNELVRMLERHDDAAFQLDILRGMSEALRGWRKATAPASWPRVAKLLATSTSETVQRTTRELAVVFGDGRALAEVRAIVADGNADPEARRNALRVLVAAQVPNLVPELHKLLADRVLALEAIRGLAVYGHADSAAEVLKLYPRLAPHERVEAVNTLVSRPAYAEALLRAVGEGKVPRGDISAFHARQIHSFGHEQLTLQLVKLWGELRDSPAEHRQQIERFKSLLTPERLASADRSDGRLLFNKTCASCHVLFGEGKQIGPDLTGSNRNNLDYLLENIIDPSAVVAADFKASVIALKNGRVITGVVLEQGERTLAIQTQNERVAIERSDIEEMKATANSLMPDGLLQPLTDDQVCSLIGYLMAHQVK